MPHKEPSVPEFRRMVEVADLGDEEARFAYAATPEELVAMARRCGVPVVERLEAEAFVCRIGGRGARARVTFHAAVVQSSVVTLDPLTSLVDEAFAVDFLPGVKRDAGPPAAGRRDEGVAAGDVADEAGFDSDAPDPPGEVIDGWFDLGDMIAEYLSLAIDSYPRQPGEEFGEWHDDAAECGGEKQEGPFAALKNWRSRV